jgi:hypothetical protein
MNRSHFEGLLTWRSTFSSDKIPTAEKLKVVAITSWLPDPMPDDHVLLPWHNLGHPRTGLKRKCAAVCSWAVMISAKDVQNAVGRVPGPLMVEIMSKVSAEPSDDSSSP